MRMSVLDDFYVFIGPLVKKPWPERILQKLLISLSFEDILVIANFQVLNVVKDSFAFKICDYHRVNAHWFYWLYRIIYIVQVLLLVDSIEYCFPLVVLDIES